MSTRPDPELPVLFHTPEHRALLSLLDVVEELAWAVEDKRWSETVSKVFNAHRAELRGEEQTTTGQFPKRRA